MEGLKSDGNVFGAKENFVEMVSVIGLDPTNFPSYDLVLCTTIKDSDEIPFFFKGPPMIPNFQSHPNYFLSKLHF
jgi:hypothetical protein